MQHSIPTKHIVGIVFIAVAASVFYFWYNGREAEPGKYDVFAQCLAEKKVTMYGTYWCPHCQNQKKGFGSAFQYVPYVECAIRGSSSQTKECTDVGIKGYPTWVFADGSRKEGEVSFIALSEKTGCGLPQ